MDVAAEVIGIRLMRTKLLAFAVSSFYCGVAGALFAYAYLGTVEPEAYNLDLSFRILFMVIIGGVGTVLGSFLGSAFIVAAADRCCSVIVRFLDSTLGPAHRRERDLEPRADGVRRADHLLPDRRAARARAAVADRARRNCGCGRSRIDAPRVAAQQRARGIDSGVDGCVNSSRGQHRSNSATSSVVHQEEQP